MHGYDMRCTGSGGGLMPLCFSALLAKEGEIR